MADKEKIKAYDDAIERAKKLYGNGITKEIFPELKKSKDKKIMEAILNGLIDCRDAPDLGWSNFGGIHIDDCIDWLEKQREQEEHKFKVENKLVQNKFDPKTLKAFDRVLARIDNGDAYCWFADFVSIPMIEEYDILPCIMSNKGVKMIIPYNEETKHIIGTSDEVPEYYRYWEN